MRRPSLAIVLLLIQGSLATQNESHSIPKIAWLMSYPSSGTSFTLRVTSNASQTRSATNYGHEGGTWNEMGASTPLMSYNSTGPYLLIRNNGDYQYPQDLVLTKTHCGGVCMKCTLAHTELSLKSFMLQCRSGVFYNGNSTERVSYPSSRVARAIHLIRNPLDNVVSRFHQYIFKFNDKSNFTRDRQGFLSYCQQFDSRMDEMIQTTAYIDPNIYSVLKKIPCRFDIVRWCNWHDMTFLTTEEMEIPTKVLYYENYNTNFTATIKAILDFLKMEWKAKETSTFVKGKSYASYFSAKEQELFPKVVQMLASKETWKHVQHYFVSNAELTKEPNNDIFGRTK